jgi:hypothetical protein
VEKMRQCQCQPTCSVSETFAELISNRGACEIGLQVSFIKLQLCMYPDSKFWSPVLDCYLHCFRSMHTTDCLAVALAGFCTYGYA